MKTVKNLTVWLLILTMACSALSLFGCSDTTNDNPAGSDPTETEPADAMPFAALDEYFVSPDGADTNDGSADHPFATPEKALDAIRTLRESGSTDAVTVSILPGEYAVTTLTFDESIGGPDADNPVVIRRSGDGTVVLNAGKRIPADAFAPVTADDAMAARFTEEAAAHILVCDLASAGLTADEIGTYLAPTRGESNTVGVYWGDGRLNLARYPNTANEFEEEAFLYVAEGAVLDKGNDEIGGTILLSDETAEHLSRWATLDGAWAFDYFNFNWAQENTPVAAFDADAKTVTFGKRSSDYKEGSEFFFYNVPEELDFPGEYWLDYDAMKLYVYPSETAADSVLLSTGKACILAGTTKNVTIEGLTFEGTNTSAVSLGGDHITFRNCVIRDCDGYGMNVSDGTDYTVYGCEFYHLGLGGVLLCGGDQAELIPGNILVENCYAHDYSEVVHNYCDGIWVSGVGNTIRHCEIAHAPHSAICATGCNNLLEWNYVHDVVQESDDAGAFYSGGRWLQGGNLMQFNKFENIGNETRSGNAVYFDDMLCGWKADSNLFINVAGFSFMCGGGRDITITNNVIISQSYLYYDDRMRENYLAGVEAFVNQDGGMWASINPANAWDYKSGVWQEQFPIVAAIVTDPSDPDNKDFPINPAYSVVKDNIWISPTKNKWNYVVDDSVKQYSEIVDPYYNADAERVFEPGTYELTKVAQRAKIDYTPIPFDGYGLYDN